MPKDYRRIKIDDGPVSLAATYDGAGYAVEVSGGTSRIELHLSQEDADRLGNWLVHGAARDHLRRRMDRRFHPGQEPGE